jgi:hypothetical protein
MRRTEREREGEIMEIDERGKGAKVLRNLSNSLCSGTILKL